MEEALIKIRQLNVAFGERKILDDFDLDKVEALNFDTLSPQLRYIFRSDEDIANFIQFLKNIQKLIWK